MRRRTEMDAVRVRQIQLKIQRLREMHPEHTTAWKFMEEARELCDEVEGLLKELGTED